MRLTVNGEKKDTVKTTTVMDLLQEMEIDPGRVAVEVNQTVIKKSDYKKTGLRDGDAVEIVNFVGGGQGTFNVYKGNKEKRIANINKERYYG
jgi:thiamine biosynthesis protein ThiS